jgi:uncharacterized repeat protein (TIGR03943 family)
MKRILSILASLVLILIGAYIINLVFSGRYSNFLNPKFIWLTGTCGIILSVLGIASFFTGLSVKPSTAVIIIVFVILCILAPTVRLHGLYVGNITNTNQSAYRTRQAPEKLPEADPRTGRITYKDNEYIPINIGELYMLLYNNPRKKVDSIIKNNRYVFRGFVYRNRQLDKKGQIAVMRVAMTCCIADAVALGFRISTNGIRKFKSDDWVRVYGHMSRFKPDKVEQTVDIDGLANTDLKEDVMFVVDLIETEKEPDEPFMLDWKPAEPYAY